MDVYVRTLQLYIGLGGIVWTGTHVGWGRQRIVELLEESCRAFQGGSNDYREYATKWLRRMLAARLQAAAAAFAIPATGIYVWIALRASTLPWFPPAWSTGSRWSKGAILVVYAIPIIVLAVSALMFIGVFTLFVLGLRRLDAVPVLPAALATLRPLAEFGLTLSVAWSVGASLFVMFFRRQPTIGTIALVAVLGAVSFVILFAPQLTIHRILMRTRADLLDALSSRLIAEAEGGAQEIDASPAQGRETFVQRLASAECQEIVKAVDWVASARTWPYGYSSLGPLLTPVILPAGVLLLRAVLGQ